jgi:ketosteroid isomerase-like protein
MLAQFLASLLGATLGGCAFPASHSQATDSTELVRLENIWNEAHLRGDTAALARLWDDDLVIAVPEMPVMSKADVLRFWRTGRSAIARYETSELRIRVYYDAAVVTGRLRRQRNFNGRLVIDDWRFTKVYIRRAGHWRVVAYQASVAAG